MRLLLGSCLFAWVVITGANAADQPATRPTFWTMDKTTEIGGHLTTILGHPQAITEPAGRSIHFNGTDDGLLLPVNPLEGLTQFTIEVLIKPDRDGPPEQRFLHLQDSLGNRGLFEIRMADQGWALDTFLYSAKPVSRCTLLDRTKLHAADHWTWVALVYANGHMAHFINGVKELDGAVNFPPMVAGQTSLGVRQNKVSWFKGSIRELRFHDVALAEKELQHVAIEEAPAAIAGQP